MVKSPKMTVVRNDAAVAIVRDSKKRLLLQKKDEGYPWNYTPYGEWCLFGGKIEDPERGKESETLAREFKEELGIELADVGFIGQRPYSDRHRMKNIQREGHLWVYHATFLGKLSDIRLGEGAGFGFFHRLELADLTMVPHNRQAIYETLDYLDSRIPLPQSWLLP